jgi:hypothetical protein
MTLKDRPTVDLVILAIAGVIGAVMVINLVAVVVLAFTEHDFDTSGLVELESEILGVLVGALVGFISGRSVGRSERTESE